MATAKTSISDNGLRYKAKGAGSPFGSSSGLANHNAMMSCFKCGKHRRIDEMQSRQLIGKFQKVCLGGCNKD